tara:strand:+ start:3429 stop:5864 length:2436 start_codon:yes stop_codon:yes gene_type:complete
MTTELEVTKRQFNSDAYNRYENDDIAIEDCRFLIFTEFLDEIDVYKNPTIARSNGLFKNRKWGTLGYSTNSFRQINEDIEVENEEENQPDRERESFDIKWEYTIFNGFFSDETKVAKANNTEVQKSINETITYLEKTFSKDYINDISEVKDLQSQLIIHFKEGNLDRLDICIVTDKVIDQDNLPNKITLKKVDIECRIYYWDLQRWNDLKRSKSKREPIHINFNSDYKLYDVPYLKQETNNNLSYYLAIFPGDLIADLYDLHNTRLLENNVRVFLSATKKANKGIRDTIKNEAYKFFSYNNGISATAESIETEAGKVINIQDFQIVNGGQTTATIHYSRKRDGNSLNDVFVAVKITRLQKNEEYSSIVSKISQAANTQSAISNSDFYANDKMLVDIEQLSLKNPVQNESDRNIYYFFERMKGQYNVSKLSRGTKKQQKNWEDTHPKLLLVTKIDLARWSNILNELPFIAAAGAQKQFEDYMNEKHFKRDQISLGRYKTLLGSGLLFKRIHKLCGTAKGKSYPSLTIDLNTGDHVPVAMSTALYTAAYIQMITKGQLDYWSFYNYEHDLCRAINTKERINSSLDRLLEKIIKVCWSQIAKFGGAAAQEKTKSVECWNFVKENTFLPEKVIVELKTFTISKKEKEKRESVVSNDEDLNYFNHLTILLGNKGHLLSSLLNISNNETRYFSEKQTVSNFIKKINKNVFLLSQKKVADIYFFYEGLSNAGFAFEDSFEDSIETSIRFSEIYENIFKNKDEFLEKFYNYIFKDEVHFDENEKLYNNIKEIIDKYYREYGLSIDDFTLLDMVLKKDIS